VLFLIGVVWGQHYLSNMAYTVKEIFYTLQGEGANSGRPAIFCRFAGCNLWSGLEHDRETAVCRFCDTDFVLNGTPGEGKFNSPDDLALAVAKEWPQKINGKPFVVCTGGEPLLQLDVNLISAFHMHGFEIAVETNGTLPVPKEIDWLCVSPKANANLLLKKGDEIKFVFPQEGVMPELYEAMAFKNFYLQPMDGLDLEKNTQQAIEYCKSHPQWRLSIQTHKILGIR
jgi:7-carboxy-7-deazaguanine synthase